MSCDFGTTTEACTCNYCSRVRLVAERDALKAENKMLDEALAFITEDREKGKAERDALRARVVELEKALGQISERHASWSAAHDMKHIAKTALKGTT